MRKLEKFNTIVNIYNNVLGKVKHRLSLKMAINQRIWTSAMIDVFGWLQYLYISSIYTIKSDAVRTETTMKVLHTSMPHIPDKP